MSLVVPVPVYSGGTSVRYVRHYPTQSTVIVGNLPTDFLRLSQDGQAAYLPQQNEVAGVPRRQALVGRLEITFVSANLKKNYGISRMDPYIRMRFCNHVYETHTCNNGAKTPYWNKTFHIYNAKKGTLGIEIYDERTLTEDELIAWTRVEIPESVWKGNRVEQWCSLSGKLGENQEGSVKMVFSYSVGPPPPTPPVVVMPSYGTMYAQTMPVYTLPPPAYPVHSYTTGMASYPTGVAYPPPQPAPAIREEDVKQLMEMFPKMDRTVVVSVLEASHGNKDSAINALLQM